MKNKELLERFIEDNFNITKFAIKWQNDYLVDLFDEKGNKLTLATIIPYQIFSLINDEKHLRYELRICLGREEWVVLND